MIYHSTLRIEFIEAIKSKHPFGFEIVFVNVNDEVVAVRHEVFTKEESITRKAAKEIGGRNGRINV